MAFPDDLFNKLFPADRKNRQPVQIMEQIRRSSQYQEAFSSWKNNSDAHRLLKEIERSHQAKARGLEAEFPIHLFDSPAANGFALTFHPDIKPQAFHFLLDYWRDRVLALGYRLANTDRQIKEKESFVETIEKHYLKPPHLRVQTKTNQGYGNILLEYAQANQQPSYLKLMVTIYSDHLFTEALPYQELVDYLFSLK